MDVSDDGKIVATGEHGSVTVWDAVNNKILQTFKRPSGNPNINCLALSRDGKQVLVGSSDGKARLWETTTGKLIQTFDGQGGDVHHVSLSFDAKRVLTSTWSKTETATLWDVATGKPIQTLTEHGGGAVFSGDAKLILTRAKGHKEAILWDATTGNPRQTLKGHTSPITLMALSGDGKYALAGAYDNKAILWDTASGKQLQTLKGHTHWVMAVALSGDGKYALTGSDDKTAILWKISEPPAANPSPLDRLDAKNIPAAERLPWQPKELVAVLGKHQQKYWGWVSFDRKQRWHAGVNESGLVGRSVSAQEQGNLGPIWLSAQGLGRRHDDATDRMLSDSRQ